MLKAPCKLVESFIRYPFACWRMNVRGMFKRASKYRLNVLSNNFFLGMMIIIHQTHYEKSDWSRAFNQFTISCDMINAISAADIAFIMSSSTSAWLPSPLECSPQKQNG